MTARRETVKIVRKFDELIKDSKYKIKKTPKFIYDKKKVAAAIVDTHIDA